jgi:hypothetical protein
MTSMSLRSIDVVVLFEPMLGHPCSIGGLSNTIHTFLVQGRRQLPIINRGRIVLYLPFARLSSLLPV